MLTTIKVLLKGEAQPRLLTISELEGALGFTYLHELQFETPELEEKIRRGCRTQKIAHLIPDHEIERGERFANFQKPPAISIRYIDETVGYGLFAEETLPMGTIIGEYTGTIKLKSEGSYIFGYGLFNATEHYVLDGSSGNYTRFVNHSNRPNLLVYDAFYNGIHHTVFETARPIAFGEQLLINYGPRYWEGREPPTTFR